MTALSLKDSRLDKRYDIRALLGQGSYAEIFVATDNSVPAGSPHREVVIKALNVFLQNDLDSDLERTLVQNFQNEALALDKVRHPNIISRLGHGTARDRNGTVFHYLVLEYLPGGDLAKLTGAGRMSIEKAFDYIEQICAGLSHAHANGVIHRDIKPQNLLLTGDFKTVKIADFGVARLMQSETPITRVGTNVYAPPEHSPLSLAEDSPDAHAELTAAADVYSLAKSTYTLVTGEAPRRFANSPITSLPQRCESEPWAGALLEVLNRATLASPRERHQDVNEFWRDLSKVRTLGGDEVVTSVARRGGDIPKAHVSRGYVPNAPKLPAFAPGPAPAQKPGATHMRPVAMPQPKPQPATEPDRPAARAAQWPPMGSVFSPKAAPKRRGAKVLAALALTVAFIGTIYVTHTALKTTGLLPGFSNVGQTGTVTTDVNLRRDSNAGSAKVGLVPRNSRVRIVNSRDNWYEIEVIQFSRPKDSPDDSNRGWVNGRYLNID